MPEDLAPPGTAVTDSFPAPASPPNARGPQELSLVCVQGLGFVGAAVAVALASARNPLGQPVHRVIGIDLATPEGLARIGALNRGTFPFPTTDGRLEERAREARVTGNLLACADPASFAEADVIVIDVPLDVTVSEGEAALGLDVFRSAIRSVGRHMRSDALVIIETTVPPGTTERIAAPILVEELAARRLPRDRFKLAHCYERVTPGGTYLDSIINMPRVYAGIDGRSADACLAFLTTFVDIDRYPPVRLATPTASELGKVLENTYRAVTIALMEEFAGFAEAVSVDLFEVVEAIRARPTHSNIRTPGFGVGGYCLTKDPLLMQLAARDLFGIDQPFPLASLAVATNRASPSRTLTRLEHLLGGQLRGRRVLLLGVSYRQDVADTRYSPSETFCREAIEKGARILVHDPLVEHWTEQDLPVAKDMPPPDGLDAVVLAVPHREYRALDYPEWLSGHRPVFLDAFDVLTSGQRTALRAAGCRVESTGRGDGL